MCAHTCGTSEGCEKGEIEREKKREEEEIRAGRPPEEGHLIRREFAGPLTSSLALHNVPLLPRLLSANYTSPSGQMRATESCTGCSTRGMRTSTLCACLGAGVRAGSRTQCRKLFPDAYERVVCSTFVLSVNGHIVLFSAREFPERAVCAPDVRFPRTSWFLFLRKRDHIYCLNALSKYTVAVDAKKKNK